MGGVINPKLGIKQPINVNTPCWRYNWRSLPDQVFVSRGKRRKPIFWPIHIPVKERCLAARLEFLIEAFQKVNLPSVAFHRWRCIGAAKRESLISLQVMERDTGYSGRVILRRKEGLTSVMDCGQSLIALQSMREFLCFSSKTRHVKSPLPD